MTEHPPARREPSARRPWAAGLAFLLLVGVASVALPVAAWIIEGISERAENWIFPLQLLLVGIVAVGYRLWRSTGGGVGRDILVGLVAALAAVLVADTIWLFGIAG